MTEYQYKPLLRPAGYATVPAGWRYAELLSDGSVARTDLPMSTWRYGVIVYDRPLTGDELEQYSLRRV